MELTKYVLPDNQLNEIRDAIISECFITTKLAYPTTNNDPAQRSLQVIKGIKSISSKNTIVSVKVASVLPPKVTEEIQDMISCHKGASSKEKKLLFHWEQNSHIDEFIQYVSNTIFNARCQRDRILTEIENSVIGDLKKYVDDELDSSFISKKTFKILTKEVHHRIWDGPAGESCYAKRTETNRGTNAAIDFEEMVIWDLREAYGNFFPGLSERQTQSNMAILFAATEFWKNEKAPDNRVVTFFERIKIRWVSK